MLTTQRSGNALLTELFRKEGISGCLCVCVCVKGAWEGVVENSSTFILKRKNANVDCVPLKAETKLISFI